MGNNTIKLVSEGQFEVKSGSLSCVGTDPNLACVLADDLRGNVQTDTETGELDIIGSGPVEALEYLIMFIGSYPDALVDDRYDHLVILNLHTDINFLFVG